MNKAGNEVSVAVTFGELYFYTLVMTEEIKRAGYMVIEIWECQKDKIVKAKHIDTRRPGIEQMKPLQPCDAYFGGCVNAVKLYYKCQDLRRFITWTFHTDQGSWPNDEYG